jgi:hypothetical protein
LGLKNTRISLKYLQKVKENSGKPLDDLLKFVSYPLLDAYNPKTGYSIFDTIGLDKDKQGRLQKAVQTAMENLDFEIEFIYARIFHLAT